MKIRTLAALALLAFSASGCVTAAEQRAVDESCCSSYGFRRGTDAYARCLLDVDLDRPVKRVAREDAICRRFMTVPGVGEITALSFKAAVDDPARFKSSRTVGAHFGLTPRRFQSGETDNPGRISHAGDADVRATLYAAANAMLMRSIT